MNRVWSILVALAVMSVATAIREAEMTNDTVQIKGARSELEAVSDDNPDRLYQAVWEHWRDESKQKYLGNSLWMCSEDSSVGHEFVILGRPDVSSKYGRSCGGTVNCYDTTFNHKNRAACGDSLGWRGGGESSSSGSNSGGGVHCDEWSRADKMVRCYQWTSISPTCSRTIADQVATHFYHHRTYSIWALFGTGSESSRLKQTCDGWYSSESNTGPQWLKEQEGKSALCWDLTITFKALYCYYQRTSQYQC
eukprot:TRINITY_DN32634_c0_g1_i1.p1 TRINITY_DN32634_c0_g1~~TRINITY_DN32634_c0_g1_i1.p1  ORF type:complete len:251 (-),score=31.71 TRINITY_DN32634_c0_g1_i1:312-1064(-)